MEREPNENSNERMSDRPRLEDESSMDDIPLPIDDTAADAGTLPPIDDV